MKLNLPVKFDVSILQVKDSMGRIVADVRRFSQFRSEVVELGEAIVESMNSKFKPEVKVSVVAPAEALKPVVQKTAEKTKRKYTKRK